MPNKDKFRLAHSKASSKESIQAIDFFPSPSKNPFYDAMIGKIPDPVPKSIKLLYYDKFN